MTHTVSCSSSPVSACLAHVHAHIHVNRAALAGPDFHPVPHFARHSQPFCKRRLWRLQTPTGSHPPYFEPVDYSQPKQSRDTFSAANGNILPTACKVFSTTQKQGSYACQCCVCCAFLLPSFSYLVLLSPLLLRWQCLHTHTTHIVLSSAVQATTFAICDLKSAATPSNMTC